MKDISKEELLKTYNAMKAQLQLLIDNTDMDNAEDRKRTYNFCDWIGIKTRYILNERDFVYDKSKFQPIKRGSVVWIDFGFNIGTEFGGRHPAIVLKRTGESIFVVPISSQEPSNIKPYHVRINKVYQFKDQVRWTNVLKIQNVSIQRVDMGAPIGNVKGDVLDKINEALENTHIV